MTFELPKDDVWCHRCDFEKKCRDLVSSGKCQRWKHVPGDSPYRFDKKTSDWGCLDDMIWWVVGDAARQADAGHAAITDTREMFFNADYRRRKLEELRAAQPQLAIEVAK